jgi:hypothetical protein
MIRLPRGISCTHFFGEGVFGITVWKNRPLRKTNFPKKCLLSHSSMEIQKEIFFPIALVELLQLLWGREKAKFQKLRCFLSLPHNNES